MIANARLVPECAMGLAMDLIAAMVVVALAVLALVMAVKASNRAARAREEVSALGARLRRMEEAQAKPVESGPPAPAPPSLPDAAPRREVRPAAPPSPTRSLTDAMREAHEDESA